MQTCVVAVVCFAILVVSIHGLTQEEKDKIKTIHNECQADPKTNADEELLKKYYKGEEVDTSIVGAHVLCMTKKYGTIDDEGKINRSKLKKALARAISDEAKLNEAVEKCDHEKDDPEETAIALGRCFQEQIRANGYEHHH